MEPLHAHKIDSADPPPGGGGGGGGTRASATELTPVLPGLAAAVGSVAPRSSIRLPIPSVSPLAATTTISGTAPSATPNHQTPTASLLPPTASDAGDSAVTMNGRSDVSPAAGAAIGAAGVPPPSPMRQLSTPATAREKATASSDDNRGSVTGSGIAAPGITIATSPGNAVPTGATHHTWFGLGGNKHTAAAAKIDVIIESKEIKGRSEVMLTTLTLILVVCCCAAVVLINRKT